VRNTLRLVWWFVFPWVENDLDDLVLRGSLPPLIYPGGQGYKNPNRYKPKNRTGAYLK
jgi:hypothetical protein